VDFWDVGFEDAGQFFGRGPDESGVISIRAQVSNTCGVQHQKPGALHYLSVIDSPLTRIQDADQSVGGRPEERGAAIL
jgi:hypothetical protein